MLLGSCQGPLDSSIAELVGEETPVVNPTVGTTSGEGDEDGFGGGGNYGGGSTEQQLTNIAKKLVGEWELTAQKQGKEDTFKSGEKRGYWIEFYADGEFETSNKYLFEKEIRRGDWYLYNTSTLFLDGSEFRIITLTSSSLVLGDLEYGSVSETSTFKKVK